jgi:glycine/D-amino acid oxidase-like deaminating enzyme/nitrite reductase/ring-hydroxylating ferredoxin subunit
VVVIGGGITGVTTARQLAFDGASVALLEAHRLASGTTGNTTAKVSAHHGSGSYSTLVSKFGADAARIYGTENQAAVEFIEERIEAEEIDCGWRRRTNYVYADTPAQRADIEREADAAITAGLPAAVVEELPLPYPTGPALAVEAQAEFDSVSYVQGLARGLKSAGVRVFENSPVRGVGARRPFEVRTADGTVTCDRVVVATGGAILDRSLVFARAHPERSYCIEAEITGDPPAGMFLSAGPETRSLRAHATAEGERLIIGGEGHKVGQGDPHAARYERLEAFAREHFDVRAITHRWSAQDWITADGAPFVGASTPLGDGVLIATGFAKWGMTGGTVAARTLAAQVRGETTPFGETFRADRLKPVASATSLVKENANVGFHFFADRARERGTRPIAELKPGEGAIVSAHGRRAAGFRRRNGDLLAVSARCTHLGCQVNFNDAEETWDCPCHGSRFAVDGTVIDGPATNPLERII